MKRVSEVLHSASAKKPKVESDDETVENVARAVSEGLGGPSDMTGEMLEAATDSIVEFHAGDGNSIDDEFSHDDSQILHVIAQHMDITEPLSTLRSLLEQKLGLELSDYTFYLQDVHELDSCKNLVDQCMEGEGLVQVNVEISTKGGLKKINIVDVLKPAEKIVEMPSLQQDDEQGEQANPDISKIGIPVGEEQENVTRWVVCTQFRKEQERLKIPFDPTQWSALHVRIWIQWAIKQFSLHGVKPDNWNMTGRHLCELSHPDFLKRVPYDKEDLFWTHLELLRKCQFVAVVQPPPAASMGNSVTLNADDDEQGEQANPDISKIGIPVGEEQESVTRWVVCTQFRKEQERLKIPFDPTQWSALHVRIWIQWAIKQFSLHGVKPDNWNMTGRHLCELSHPDFLKRVPYDKGDIFWTHLELLRKCKFVAVVHRLLPHEWETPLR